MCGQATLLIQYQGKVPTNLHTYIHLLTLSPVPSSCHSLPLPSSRSARPTTRKSQITHKFHLPVMTQNGTLTVPAIIDNKDVDFDASFPVQSPASGSHLYHSTSASVADALTAVESALKAFHSWKKTKPTTRRDVFLKAAQIVEKRGDELGKYMMDETAASEFWGSGFNVPLAADMLKDVAGRISSVQGSVPIPGAEGKSAMVWKEPYGVILGIAPW